MSTTQHTPGPWYVGPDISSEGHLVYLQIFDGPSKRAVACSGVYGHRKDGSTAGTKYLDRAKTERHKPYISADEARANAALIAAAPTMLETLQSISGDAHELLRGHNLPESVLELVGAIEDAAQAAIAKAEGR